MLNRKFIVGITSVIIATNSFVTFGTTTTSIDPHIAEICMNPKEKDKAKIPIKKLVKYKNNF